MAEVIREQAAIVKQKPVYTSKTLWANLIMAIAAIFLPGTSEWLQTHPDIMAGMFTVVNAILRLVTKTDLKVA